MKEDRQKICNLLVPVFKELRGLRNVESIEYSDRQEFVYIKFASGFYKVVNVAGESGAMMVVSVLKEALK